MKNWIVFGLFFVLAACGGDEVPQAQFASPQTGWRHEAGGDLRHGPSGIGFPEAVGAYKRMKVIDFAKDGSDVGVVYKAPEGPDGAADEITLYATYHEGISAQQYLNSATQAIVDRFEGLEFVQEGTFTPEGGNPIVGPYRLFKITLGGTGYRTGVWVAKDGNWMLKARFTYPANKDEVAALVDAMMSELSASTPEGVSPISYTVTNNEGVALDMVPVADVLKAVRWSE
ncbi:MULTISPECIES: hypothetical protein [Kordiimonas]|jgi:hypothetical protein|uniref:hypothetical protein n=1 Tax=Kordiimonas TaxID=288021 RepID=UPI00257BC1AD|nr:hypothetical protein [Kordiimonas sp. UBA4487]